MYPVEVAKVAQALGGERTMGVPVATLSDLAHAVAGGLPRAVVRAVAANSAPAEGGARLRVAALMASPATLKRGERLSPAASERAERIARVTALARQALDDDDEARTWLNEPHPMLGARPIDLAATDLGARMVERLLHDIEHSLPA